MKVGDLVIFRKCRQQGTFGIISRLTKPSHVAKYYPLLKLYWVAFEGREELFTGNQLVPVL